MESTNAVGAVAESTQNFLKVQAVVVQGVNTIFWAPMFWGTHDSDNREAGVFKHRESAGTRK